MLEINLTREPPLLGLREISTSTIKFAMALLQQERGKGPEGAKEERLTRLRKPWQHSEKLKRSTEHTWSVTRPGQKMQKKSGEYSRAAGVTVQALDKGEKVSLRKFPIKFLPYLPYFVEFNPSYSK